MLLAQKGNVTFTCMSWQVMDANKEKSAAERVHLEVSQAFNEMQEKKTRLQKSLKSVIHKTRYIFVINIQYYRFANLCLKEERQMYCYSTIIRYLQGVFRIEREV